MCFNINLSKSQEFISKYEGLKLQNEILQAQLKKHTKKPEDVVGELFPEVNINADSKDLFNKILPLLQNLKSRLASDREGMDLLQSLLLTEATLVSAYLCAQKEQHMSKHEYVEVMCSNIKSLFLKTMDKITGDKE